MESRPPSVDALARSLSGLPQPLLVDAARDAITAGDPASAERRVVELQRSLLTPVINATGVLLHTNLGRAPLAHHQDARAQTVEFDLTTGERGSRQRAVGRLFARLCDAESAIVVNNNASAVLLVLAALASGRSVAVSRGESVEIGGSFRVPEVMEQSGARLVDVGTTNRTRLGDYRAAIDRHDDLGLVLKVHPSNYRVEGFVESTSVDELATLGVPVMVDLGSGLLDARCPWLGGTPPAWLAGEPAARQTLAAGADIVTFSGDKLLGGPQAGIIAGRRDLIERCARHPLMRALRPGGLVLGSLQELALAYLRRDGDAIPIWRMATAPVDVLRSRAETVIAGLQTPAGTAAGGPATSEGTPAGTAAGAPATGASTAASAPGAVVPGSGVVTAVDTDAVPGAGSAPGVTIPSYGIAIDGDVAAPLRAHDPPVIARVSERTTILDLRTVDPADDVHVVEAVRAVMTSR